MKHPGPWTSEWLTCHPPRLVAVVDANMIPVICAHSGRREMCLASDEAERIILAAPVLLEAMRELAAHCEHMERADWDEFGSDPKFVESDDLAVAKALIERIEKGETHSNNHSTTSGKETDTMGCKGKGSKGGGKKK